MIRFRISSALIALDDKSTPMPNICGDTYSVPFAVFGGVLFLTELPQKVVAFFVIGFALVPLWHVFVTDGNGGEKLTLHI